MNPPVPLNAPQDVNFAEEMRTERLGIIWKITLAISTIAVWFYVIIVAEDLENAIQLAVLPWLLVLGSSVACYYLLKRKRVDYATWAYALGAMVALAVVLYYGDGLVRQIAPFVSLVVIFIVGLMLPIRATFWMIPLSLTVLIAPPLLSDGSLSALTEGTYLTIFLSLLTLAVSAQASGELFAIADWALENYRKEREGANKLYESRLEIERSLVRQRGLTTELKTANDELAIAQRAAEEAKHFRGQFLANMSHELRTPLNAVIGFSDTMLNFPMMYNMIELPPEYRADLEQIHNSGKHLLNIINDILDLSKIDAGRLEVEIGPVELEPIIKSVLSIAVGLVGGKHIKLQRDTPEHLPLVKGDPVRIRQCMLNVYSNAAKFTDEGSIKLTIKQDEDKLTLSVQDSGEGIHPQDLPHIFEEFRQGSAGRKKARAGSGLGMTITRQLLSLMGGEIWVESVYGEGSTFTFTLPLYQAEPATAEPAAS
jgi:signal transduction histidine kinase